MIKVGVGIKARVVKSDQPNIKVGDEWALFEAGDNYESNGFFFSKTNNGLIEMGLFRGGVLLEECKKNHLNQSEEK